MTQVCNEMTRPDQTFCCNALGTLLSPDMFRALGDPNRLSVVVDLAGKSAPSTVSDIAPCCQVDYSVVSRHLAILRRAGIVESEKRGREVFYRLRYDQVANSLRQMADAIEECCPGAGGWLPAGTAEEAAGTRTTRGTP